MNLFVIFADIHNVITLKFEFHIDTNYNSADLKPNAVIQWYDNHTQSNRPLTNPSSSFSSSCDERALSRAYAYANRSEEVNLVGVLLEFRKIW